MSPPEKQQFDVDADKVKGIYAVVAARNMVFSDENIVGLFKTLNPTFAGMQGIEQFCAERDYPEELTDPDELSELLEVLNTVPARLKNTLIILQVIGARAAEPVGDRPQQVPVVFLTFFGTSFDDEIIFSQDIPINFKKSGSIFGRLKSFFGNR